MNSSDVSTSKTPQAMETVTPATLAILSAGEFVGIVADDPGKEIELRGFFARFVKKGWGKSSRSVSTPFRKQFLARVFLFLGSFCSIHPESDSQGIRGVFAGYIPRSIQRSVA